MSALTPAPAGGSGRYSSRIFKDGTRKRVNLLGLLEGPVFEPLRDPVFFAQVMLDPVAATVVWPNGADLDPLVLYSLVTGEPLPGRPSKVRTSW